MPLTTRLEIDDQTNGSNNNTWGDVTDSNLQILEQAIAGVTGIATTGGTTTLTSSQNRFPIIVITGTLVSNATINVRAAEKNWQFINATSGAFTVTVKTPSGSGQVLGQGESRRYYCDGVNVMNAPHGNAIADVTGLQTALDAKAPLSLPFSFRNKLINGAFDFWQRAPFQVTGGYGSADRWAWSYGSGGTFALARQSSNGDTLLPEGTLHYANITQTVAPTTVYSLAQRIESVRTLAGRPVILSFYARRSGTIEILPYLTQRFGTGGSPSASVYVPAPATIVPTGTWARYTIPLTLADTLGKTLGTNGDDHLEVGLTIMPSGGGGGTGSIDIACVQLEEGSAATAFERRPLGQELALCQRYFANNNGSGYPLYILTNSASIGQQYGTSITLPVPMRVTPTIAVLSDLSSGAGTVSYGAVGNQAVFAQGNFTTTGSVSLNTHVSASAEL